MKKHTTKYYLLSLIILFATPGIAAYFLYQHPSWLGSATINKGTLLHPPISLNALDRNTKWRIIYWSPGVCDKGCLQRLEILAKIRLALGRKLYQVDQWLILGDKAPSLSNEAKTFLKEIDFKVAQLSGADASIQDVLFSEPKVFLADPGNYLVLSYASQVNPEDVYKDLKLLLNTTKKQE